MADTIVASFGQEQMWLLDRLEKAGATYCVPLPIRIEGTLDRAALAAAVRQVLVRHEILRTTLHFDDGQVVQRVHEDAGVLDVVGRIEVAPGSHGEASWREDARRRASRPFALDELPLVRFVLYPLAPLEHVLLVLAHHSVVDGWSQHLLVDELAVLCDDARAGRPPSLPELPIQYADFAMWQRGRLGEIEAADAPYWRSALGDEPPLLALPRDRHGEASPDWRGDCVEHPLDAATVEQLAAYARARHTSRAMVTTAAFALLLSRLVRRRLVVFGLPASGRVRGETAGLIGYFVNTLPICVPVDPGVSFDTLVDTVGGVVTRALEHQDLPLERIVAGTPASSRAAGPLVRAVCAHQTTHEATRGDTTWRADPLAVHNGTAKFDVSLFVVERGTGVHVALEYRQAAWEAATAVGWLREYTALLAAALASPGAPVNGLLAPPAGERDERPAQALAPQAARGRNTELPAPEGPTTSTEVELALLWTALLGAPPDRHAHFFHLGGHSLLAAQLAFRIRQAFGVDLPLHVVREAPTLAGMAERIDLARVTPASLVVPLREGEGSTLFVPYSMEGELLYAGDLAAALPPDVALWGMLPSANDTNGETLADLARPLVDALIAAGCEPIHLAGYSFSGMLAYEIAVQLRARGAQVGLLALIDSGPGERPTPGMLPRRALRFARNLPHWLVDDLLTHSLSGLFARAGRKLASVPIGWRAWRDGDARARARAMVRTIYDPETLPEAHVDAMHHRLDLLFRYEPPRYGGPMLLVRATARPLLYAHEADLGWSGLVDRLEIACVRANHHNIVQRPQAAAVAALLTKAALG